MAHAPNLGCQHKTAYTRALCSAVQCSAVSIYVCAFHTLCVAVTILAHFVLQAAAIHGILQRSKNWWNKDDCIISIITQRCANECGQHKGVIRGCILCIHYESLMQMFWCISANPVLMKDWQKHSTIEAVIATRDTNEKQVNRHEWLVDYNIIEKKNFMAHAYTMLCHHTQLAASHSFHTNIYSVAERKKNIFVLNKREPTRHTHS